MSDNDIYTTPSSNLTEPQSGSEFGSVENALAGNYTLEFTVTFSESWRRVKGAKGEFWLALLLYFVCIGVVQIVVGTVIAPLLGEIYGAVLGQVIITFVSAPINAGIAILGVRRMANASLRSTSVFDYFDKIVPLFLCTLLMYLLILLGFALLVLPGIYLSVAYMFALTLIAEKNMGIWEALETSRKAVTHKWFTVFLLLLCVGLLMIVAMLLLFISLIWAVPLSILVFAKIYLTIFGVEKATLERE